MARHVPSQAGNETSEDFEALLSHSHLSIACQLCSVAATMYITCRYRTVVMIGNGRSEVSGTFTPRHARRETSSGNIALDVTSQPSESDPPFDIRHCQHASESVRHTCEVRSLHDLITVLLTREVEQHRSYHERRHICVRMDKQRSTAQLMPRSQSPSLPGPYPSTPHAPPLRIPTRNQSYAPIL